MAFCYRSTLFIQLDSFMFEMDPIAMPSNHSLILKYFLERLTQQSLSWISAEKSRVLCYALSMEGLILSYFLNALTDLSPLIFNSDRVDLLAIHKNKEINPHLNGFSYISLSRILDRSSDDNFLLIP